MLVRFVGKEVGLVLEVYVLVLIVDFVDFKLVVWYGLG